MSLIVECHFRAIAAAVLQAAFILVRNALHILIQRSIVKSYSLSTSILSLASHMYLPTSFSDVALLSRPSLSALCQIHYSESED